MEATPMPWPTTRDDALFSMIDREVDRQNTTLQLIASENFASPAVMSATGSVLTNKYSEGYPGKRYYGGNQIIDEVEELARTRATTLFGAEHANVQPHSGANANVAVYLALLKPGDKVLGMSLDHGGHLTHGSPVNFSGLTYDFVAYGVSKSDERIDFDNVREIAKRERPAADHRGCHRLFAHHRPGAAAVDRRRGRCVVDVRRRAHRRAHRRRRAPEPGAVLRHRHLHHAQDAARPARWLHLEPQGTRRGHRPRGLPRVPGWSARERPSRPRRSRSTRRPGPSSRTTPAPS